MLPFLPSRLLKGLEDAEWKINAEAKCNCCDSLGAVTFTHKIYVDFNIEKNKEVAWIKKFKWAEEGLCMTCGHFQRYSKLNNLELEEYLSMYSDKALTNGGIISNSSVYKGEDSRIEAIRVLKNEYYHNKKVNSVYMARPTSVKLVEQTYHILGANKIDVRENNGVIKAAIEKSLGDKNWVSLVDNYEVHGKVELPKGFDLYIITHCLQHSIDLGKDLEELVEVVKLGGAVLLLDEIQRKIHNPFHVNHMSEVFLKKE